MASKLDERLAFDATWRDPQAHLDKHYQLFFYPADNSIEMFDVKQRRTFLKRSKYEQLRLDDLFEGAAVKVFSRQLVIRGFGDEFTRNRMTKDIERTMLLILSDAYPFTGQILDVVLAEAKFSACRLRMIDFPTSYAREFLSADYQNDPAMEDMVKALTHGPVTAIELMRINGVEELKRLAGPMNVQDAKQRSPGSLRARFGSEGYKSGIIVSSSTAAANREFEYIFGESAQHRFTRPDDENSLEQDCTLAIVKPHAFISAQSGKIIDVILKAGYYITEMELFHLNEPSAEEFLEVYKGVVQEFHAMVNELTSGPVIAMKVTRPPSSNPGPPVVTAFREFVGPSEPEIARQLRPTSLRAKFGLDKIRNAVHCTDLKEDGVLEVQYFFRILSS